MQTRLSLFVPMIQPLRADNHQQGAAGGNRRFNGLGKIVPGPDFHIPKHLLLTEAIDQIVCQASGKPLASPSAVADEYPCHSCVPRIIEKFSKAVSLLQGISFLRFAVNHSLPAVGRYVKSAAEEHAPAYSML
jgi:hypothetical protein